MAFLYICVCFGSFIGGVLLLVTFFGGMSAPQQGAMAAVAIGCAVIPYVFARSIDLADQGAWRRAFRASVSTGSPHPDAAIKLMAAGEG